MDKMTLYEARDISKNILYVDRNQREIERYQLYVAIQSHSKNKLSLKEVLELPWDNNFLVQKEFTYSEEEEKRTTEQAKSFEDLLNNGSINFESANLMKR